MRQRRFHLYIMIIRSVSVRSTPYLCFSFRNIANQCLSHGLGGRPHVDDYARKRDSSDAIKIENSAVV